MSIIESGDLPTESFTDSDQTFVEIEIVNSSIASENNRNTPTCNILVPGGAGYIGSVTTAALIEAGNNVIVYDNLSHGHRAAIHQDALFIEGDISDGKLLRKVLTEHHIDAVMDFAAFIEAGESMKKPELYFGNNSVNTITLLDAMLDVGIKKFCFSSTAALFGNPEKTPIAEDAKLAPTNAYGESKLIIEQVLRWYHEIHGLKYAALRYFNATGATPTLGEDHKPESHLIPIAMQAAMGKRPKLSLFGTDYDTHDGTCIRDYIHVTDLANAHVLAINALNEPENGRLIFNLGSEQGFSNREVIEAVGRVVGNPVPYDEAPRRPGDPAVLIASSARIREKLGWARQYTSLDTIIETAYKWRRDNPNGYNS